MSTDGPIDTLRHRVGLVASAPAHNVCDGNVLRVVCFCGLLSFHTLWFGQGWEREGGHLVGQATTVGFFQHVGSTPSFVGPLGSAEGGCTFFTAAALGASMHTAKYTPQPLSILSIVAKGGTEGDVAKKKKKKNRIGQLPSVTVLHRLATDCASSVCFLSAKKC